MSVRVKFTVDAPVLQDSIQSSDHCKSLQYKDITLTPSGDIQVLIQAETNDINYFVESVEEDNSVTNTEAIGPNLFKTEYAPATDEIQTQKTVVNNDAAILDAKSFGEGWNISMVAPTPDCYVDLVDQCERLGMPVNTECLIDGYNEPEELWYLTTKQKDIISTAYNKGYFSVPRQCTLSDIAEELCISQQAASQRMHRALSQMTEAIMEDYV